MGFLAVIGIIYIIVRLAKEASDDAWLREQARKDGLDFYASSTGLKDIKTNKPYRK